MRNSTATRIWKYAAFALAVIVILLSLPLIYSRWVIHEQTPPATSAAPAQFPVTVDPKDKMITENADVDSYLEGDNSPMEASAAGTGGLILNAIKSLAVAISKVPFYQNLASLSGVEGQFITIAPGMRKEQVADLFGKSLSWDDAQKQELLTPAPDSSLPLSEGSFFPATYFVNDDISPSDAQALIDQRFADNVLAHYGTTTQNIVPLDEALTIASIIQRETIGGNDMRLISGILWNRIFNGMDLQVDATLQYAKANLAATTVWWPTVAPKDKYIKSPYNTYENAGLPPTPIANPSVAAIVAALNPINTPCLYYFNDKEGNFHCSATYAEHMALLKQYYGASAD